MKSDFKLRRVGIYARLCQDFNEQAENMSPDFQTTKQLVEKFPWVSTHPWSVNGIPDSFEDIDFNIMRELREEFALIAKTYDPDLAHSYECAALDFSKLLKP